MSNNSPVQEESGCGGGIFSTLTGQHPPLSTSNSNLVRLLVGSKHHFDLVKISLGASVHADSTRILTLASGSSTGAISATEVRRVKKSLVAKYMHQMHFHLKTTFPDLLWPGIWGSFEPQLLVSRSKSGGWCCKNSPYWVELGSFVCCLCFPLHLGFFHRCHWVQICRQWVITTNLGHAWAQAYYS